MNAQAQELPDAGAIGKALERVFARPELRPPEKGFAESALESVFKAVGEAIRWVWNLLEGGLSNPFVAWSALGVLCALAALLVARLLARIARDAKAKGLAMRRVEVGVERTQLNAARERLGAAARLAGEARFLEAAHALYEGVLLWLDDAGHARFESSKTGGEYAREIRGAGVASPFRALLGAYYPIAFGARPDAKSAFARMREAAGRMGVPL